MDQTAAVRLLDLALKLRRGVLDHNGRPAGLADVELATASMSREAGGETERGFEITAVHKIWHDLEQAEYLIEHNRLSEPRRALVEKQVLPMLRGLHSNMSSAAEYRSSRLVYYPGYVRIPRELLELPLVAKYNNRIWNLPRYPAVDGPAINPDLDFEGIQDMYTQSSPHLFVTDQLLSPRALERARASLLESSYWHEVKPWHILGAYVHDGLTDPIFLQIAHELPKRFPRVFGDHKLTMMWAYKYDRGRSGIDIHHDPARINVNMWITPDEANNDPSCGGLIIFNQSVKHSFTKHPNLAQDGSAPPFADGQPRANTTVPYRANRVVVFDSDRDHMTDRFDFKAGYANRRINLTFLYGEPRLKA